MTVEFRKFPSIEQFRNIIKQVRQHAQYHNEPVPTLTFKGTVKLHGTNSAVGFDSTGGVIYQSRERTLSLTTDNAGFYAFASRDIIQEELNTIKDDFLELNGIQSYDTFHIYGEWCGGSIQKGVALNQLDKMFVIFSIVVDNVEWDIPESFSTRFDYSSVKFINRFPTYELEIDFNFPEKVQNTLVELTIDVENECPVGKVFGVSGIGEGIVWYNHEHGLRFKTKGEKHSASKVKTVKAIAQVDVEKMESLNEFVDMACSETRLNQGLEKLREAGLDDTDNKNTGEFIRWMCSDIFKEESDTIIESQFDAKQVGNRIAFVARQFYLNRV